MDALARRDAFCAGRRTPALLLYALYLGPLQVPVNVSDPAAPACTHGAAPVSAGGGREVVDGRRGMPGFMASHPPCLDAASELDKVVDGNVLRSGLVIAACSECAAKPVRVCASRRHRLRIDEVGLGVIAVGVIGVH